MVASNAFVEWANVHGRRYGTSKAIEERISKATMSFLKSTSRAPCRSRRSLPTPCSSSSCPSWDELRSRLERRGEDSADVIEMRLRTLRRMAHVSRFDFVIINRLFERALFDLKPSSTPNDSNAAQRRARAETFLSLNIS